MLGGGRLGKETIIIIKKHEQRRSAKPRASLNANTKTGIRKGILDVGQSGDLS